LFGAHLLGQGQQLTKQLDSTGGGDASDTDEQFKGLLQYRCFICSDEVEDLPAQAFNLSIQVSDAVLQISD